jgi:hypothetical protein
MISLMRMASMRVAPAGVLSPVSNVIVPPASMGPTDSVSQSPAVAAPVSDWSTTKLAGA